VKLIHEIRDPIHTFIKMDADERRIVDSRPFQRLRHIKQLALTSLVYPGAMHTRFEHSLGVMELASRMYDTVTSRHNVNDQVTDLVPELATPRHLDYWRTVLRASALCHDLGHLPFSHAAEGRLLPRGWSHERLTREFIQSSEVTPLLEAMKLQIADVVKLAIGPEKAADLEFSPWEALLAELIVGDAFGADRMDYLLRDSHHLGVAYGRFDHHRLIDTLRVLPVSPSDKSGAVKEAAVGVEDGGLLSAEALLLARYFMFAQVYMHPVRRVYDIHLGDFLATWLPGGEFPTSPDKLLRMTDNEVLVAVAIAAEDPDAAGHLEARRIAHRQHFKEVYRQRPGDADAMPGLTDTVCEALRCQFGAESVRLDKYSQRSVSPEFPVLLREGGIASSLGESGVLSAIPPVVVDCVYVDRSISEQARVWLKEEMATIVEQGAEKGATHE
jgi:HD superfamily phosphohydrolase